MYGFGTYRYTKSNKFNPESLEIHQKLINKSNLNDIKTAFSTPKTIRLNLIEELSLGKLILLSLFFINFLKYFFSINKIYIDKIPLFEVKHKSSSELKSKLISRSPSPISSGNEFFQNPNEVHNKSRFIRDSTIKNRPKTAPFGRHKSPTFINPNLDPTPGKRPSTAPNNRVSHKTSHVVLFSSEDSQLFHTSKQDISHPAALYERPISISPASTIPYIKGKSLREAREEFKIRVNFPKI